MNITKDIIYLNQSVHDKNEALALIAQAFEQQGYTATGYLNGLLDRENQIPTYIDCGVAIPHGTPKTKDLVKQTGVVIFHFPKGVVWGENQELAYLAVGIAAKSDEHIAVLKLLTKALDDDNIEQKIANIQTEEDILNILTKEDHTNLSNDDLIISLQVTTDDMDELKAISLAKLTRAKAINTSFASHILTTEPILLVNGVWLSTSAIGNLKEQIVLAKPQQPLNHQGNNVELLITIADTGKITDKFYTNLANTILNNHDSNKIISLLREE